MYAVIFRAEFNELDEEYSAMTDKLRDIAMGNYGCKEFITSTEGSIETAISYWEDETQIRKWKLNSEHLIAQGKGRSKWYKSYSVEVVKIVRTYQSVT